MLDDSFFDEISTVIVFPCSMAEILLGLLEILSSACNIFSVSRTVMQSDLLNEKVDTGGVLPMYCTPTLSVLMIVRLIANGKSRPETMRKFISNLEADTGRFKYIQCANKHLNDRHLTEPFGCHLAHLLDHLLSIGVHFLPDSIPPSDLNSPITPFF